MKEFFKLWAQIALLVGALLCVSLALATFGPLLVAAYPWLGPVLCFLFATFAITCFVVG